MIVAVGLDLVELVRIRRAMQKHPKRFVRKVFHPDEVAELQGRIDLVPGLAARFAAKEAFQKVWPSTFGWKDVWVAKEGKRPILRVAPDLARIMEQQSLRVHLSLTHAREQAAAARELGRREEDRP